MRKYLVIVTFHVAPLVVTVDVTAIALPASRTLVSLTIICDGYSLGHFKWYSVQNELEKYCPHVSSPLRVLKFQGTI
jgi:hypothetical protein